MDNIEQGKSFQRLATLLLIAGGSMLLGAWTFYNAFQINPDLPKILNHLSWMSVGAIFIILSFFIWYIGHLMIIGKISNRKTEKENMMNLLKDMAKGTPSWYYPQEHLKTFISTEDGIKQLVKMNIINDDGKPLPYYITPIGIQLISAWESERINKKLIWLTIILIIMGIANIITMYYVNL